MLDALDKNYWKQLPIWKVCPREPTISEKTGNSLTGNIGQYWYWNNADGTGIIVTIKPGTKNESVHIPVILSQAGLFDVVYNSFIIGEGAEVTIVAGCGIHCGTSESEGHAGIHDFQVGKKAKVNYVEKHFAMGEGSGRRTP